jgi:hypothetical protein
MALHRDIFWVGRQWAVTGFGVQAVDQRLKGAFDIEIARLWDDDLPQRMRALAWLKADDFENALNVARSRFPEPPRKSLPLVESVLELIAPVASEPLKPKVEPRPDGLVADPPLREPAKAVIAPIEARPPSSEPPKAPISLVEKGRAEKEPVAIDRPQAQSRPLELRIEHVSAKFLPRWRIRH